MSVHNFNPADPFDADKSEQEGLIHIRIQQRNGRKTLTTVQGIAEKFDKRRLVKYFKKTFSCNGTIVNHPEHGEVIQLQGDQRERIQQFLINVKLANEDQIKVHGF